MSLLMVGCAVDEQPIDTTIDVPALPSTSTSTTVTELPQEAPVSGGGGSGLPVEPSNDEINCENAEELCDSGEWACDDIADYCDIGPDGGELPDDWDWDR